jgi:hypothetical protein
MKDLKKNITTKIRKYLIEPENSQNVEKYIGNTFAIQDATAEITVGKRKDDWGLGGDFRERIENAGDILRELSSRGHRPDCRYIEEKVEKIEYWLKKSFTEIPSDIKTLEDFNKTILKWSDAVDSRDFVVKFYSTILKQTINEYQNIPVYSKETAIAKELVLNLLYGNFNELKINLKQIKNICETIKHDGYITFTSL